MRALWIILALLIFAAAAALWNRLSSTPHPDDAALDAVRAAASGGSVLTSSPASEDRDGAPAALAQDPSSPASAAASVQGAAEKADRPADDPASDLVDDLLRSHAERSAGDGASGQDGSGNAETPTSATAGEPITDGLNISIPGATVAPGVIVRLPDGVIRADDRFTIRGSGAADDPYLISWQLLASAAESYQPRLGENRIPQRVAMLHGKHVRIEGYATFPIFSFDPTEMLMMLNQWDGCCIGVPPTPYDAIEVKLAQAPRERRRQTSYFGAVEGVLRVEPYLVENWLVGLYVMDDAKLSLEL